MSNQTIFENPIQVTSYTVGEKKDSTQLVSFDKVEKEVKSIGPNEVFVELICSSICHTDWFTFNSKGAVPGHEMVGIVKHVGENVSKEGKIKVGMRVGMGYQFNSCRHCETCVNHLENLCDSSKPFYTAPIGGGYQTGVVWDAHFVFPIPDKLKSIHAAPLLCAGATVFVALHRYGKNLQYKVNGRAPSCAVLGLGGLGHLAIQYAKKMGLHVTALSTSSNKEQECRSFGADEFYVHTTEESKDILKAKFDIILNTVSGDIEIDKFVAMLRPYGQLCMLGLPSNPRYDLSAFTLLLKARSIVTSVIGSPDELNMMLQFSAENDIKPQIELTTLDKVSEAIEKVNANHVRYRMVMVVNQKQVDEENK